jgi:polyhydroxybutyrate depolymerase
VSDRRNRTVWILVAAVVALLAVVGVLVALLVDQRSEPAAPPTTSAPRSSTTTTTTTAPSGQASTGVPVPGYPASVRVEDRTFQEGLIQRQYLVMTPADSPSGRRLPVVMVLHGLGFDRVSISKTADWAAAVARDQFIAVFPQGVLNSWNAGPCCPPASLARVDDVGFLDRVVGELTRRPDVDRKRLYLTGFSNGGIMTYTMACARPRTFAAVAPMAGSNVSGCAPAVPVSLLHMHGDPDPTVPYDGQVTLSQLLSSADFPPVPDSVAAWAKADGCDPTPTTTESPGPVSTRRWSGCGSGTEVELITYPGNGHVWPTLPVDGLAELLRFFDLQS